MTQTPPPSTPAAQPSATPHDAAAITFPEHLPVAERREEIMAAIREASETLDQVIFAGLTHEPAEALARELLHHRLADRKSVV